MIFEFYLSDIRFSASHIERPMSPYDEQSESEKLLIDDASQLQEKTTDVSDLKLHGRFST